MAPARRGKAKPVSTDEDVASSVARLFDECQRSFAVHRRCSEQMHALRRAEPETFIQVFTSHVQRILLVFKKEGSVERLVKFVAHFATSADNEDNEVATLLIGHLLEFSNTDEKAVRFRVCQIIGALMASLPEDFDISDELYESIVEGLLERTKDKVAAVRAEAVQGLSRLQDPTDSDDAVLVEFARLLSTDSNRDVRKAVLKHIGVTGLTLPEIIKRTRDIREDVRVAAFVTLGEKVDPNWMAISSRVQLISSGLGDRCATVQQACVDMLGSWLERKDFENSIPKFLGIMDIEMNEEVAVKAVRALLDNGIGRSVGGPSDPLVLTAEGAMCWRTQVTRLKEIKNLGELDDLLPDVPMFCAMLVRVMKEEFVTRQYLAISCFLDVADEAGRRSLSKLLHDLLRSESLSTSLVPSVVASLRSFAVDEFQYSRSGP